jgi:hypothetical protein
VHFAIKVLRNEIENDVDYASRQSAKYVLALKAKHNITDTAIDDIVEITQDYVSDIVSTVENRIVKKCRQSGVEVDFEIKDLFNVSSMHSLI